MLDAAFKSLIQFLIAIDQLINTLTWAKYEGLGFADETLSARMWRLRHSRNWNIARIIVDFIFALLFKQHNHCYISFLDEINRHQLPLDYQYIMQNELNHLKELPSRKER